MSFSYKYTINNLKYLDQLYNYIASLHGLPSDFSLLSEDQVSIIFKEQLSDGQINVLSNAINNYSPPQYYTTIHNTEAINIIQNQVNKTVYTCVSTNVWLVDRTINSGDIDLGNIVVVSNLVGPQDGIIVHNANYMIRLYDAINNFVLFESNNLVNTDLQILTFSNIQNIPITDTLLQLQVKVSSTNYLVNVSAAHFTYFQMIGYEDKT